MEVDLKVKNGNLVLTLPVEAKALSTTIYGGGFKSNLRHVVFHSVPSDFNEDPLERSRKVVEDLNLNPECSAVFLTAVKVKEMHVVVKGETTGAKCYVAATIGLGNPVSCSHGSNGKASTINIFVAVDRDLSDNGLVELVKTVTEAKVSAIHDVDLRCNLTYAIGTSTDALIVASLRKPSTEIYTGQLTSIGNLVSRLVYKSILMGAEKWGYSQGRSMIKRLDERGVKLKDIVDSAMSLFKPWKKLPVKKAREAVKDEILRCLEDVNVSSMINAALRLDEDARTGLIPHLKPQQYVSDPVHLVSDEILALSLALYLNGWNAVFELYRYDTEKPGILSRLPPFIDDMIAALIAGATSRIYSRGGK